MQPSEKRTRPRIAYLTGSDPRDRRSWSGTHYYIAQALQEYCGDVVFIGPIRPRSTLLRKAIREGLRLLFGKNYLYTHTTSLSKQAARIAEKRIADEDYDLIFAPAGSAQIAYLQTNIPVVYLSDATFDLLLDYHPDFFGVSEAAIREGNQIEQSAIDRATLVLYPSAWAAESARKHYHADPAKLHVVPFGANLDSPPSLEMLFKKPDSDTCNLLFVGVDWANKGGDVAFETLIELERLGINAQLTVVGCVPGQTFQHKNLRVFPFLNKNEPGERQQLYELYMSADFFLLPTLADCSPIVLREASAFGIPALARDTGGISDIMRNGENGYLLPANARGREYAQVIADVYPRKSRYMELRHSSRAAYDARLNWDAWGETVARLLGNSGFGASRVAKLAAG